MPNSFDQFDSGQASGVKTNSFDRFDAVSPSAPTVDNRPKSFIEGVKQGLQTPVLNAGSLIETGLDKLGIRKPVYNAATAVEHGLDNLFGLQHLPSNDSVASARGRAAASNAASPYKPSSLGKFTGEFAGTAPTMLLPGGALVQGGAAGGLLTNKRTPSGVAGDMAFGAVSSKLGDVAVRKIANAVAPATSKAIQILRDAGVDLTPGQIARGSEGAIAANAAKLEDRATSLPFTGSMVDAARAKTLDQFNRGAANRALQPLGETLPDDVATGHDMVGYLQKRLGKAYDDALSQMKLVPDGTLQSDVANLASDLRNGGLDTPHLARFKQTIQNVVVRRADGQNGILAGDTLKTTLSELRTKAAQFGKSSLASEQEYGGALDKLADILEDNAVRTSPKAASDLLKASDAGYANLVRIEGAAKMAPEGVFTPNQLNTAVRQADASVRKRAVAAGRGLMQDYASAGVKILSSKLGDSGTAARMSTWNPIAYGVGAAAAIPYKAAQTAAPLLIRKPGPAAARMSQMLGIAAPVAGAAIPPLLMRPSD